MGIRLRALIIAISVGSLFISLLQSEGGISQTTASMEENDEKSMAIIFQFIPEDKILVTQNGRTELSCNSILSANIGEPDTTAESSGELKAEIKEAKGGPVIAVENDQMVFASASDVREIQPFTLMENTPDYFIAVRSHEYSIYHFESFVLNKQNGLAILSRIRPLGRLGKKQPRAPDSQTIYLQCKKMPGS
jgi:hypothetical protein